MNGTLGRPWAFTIVRAVLAVFTLIYLPFVVRSVGYPDWGAPWQPRAGGDRPLVFTLVAVLAIWMDAWVVLPSLARRKAKAIAALDPAARERATWARFLVRATLLYSGAPAGAGLAFVTRDARYAVILAAASAVMVLLLPRPKLSTASPSGAA
jgi:hypothetical protein